MDLLPCPYCGNDVNDDEGCFQSKVSPPRYEVRCGNPYCFANDGTAASPQEAADKWNRRI